MDSGKQGRWQVRSALKSLDRIKKKMKDKTRRNGHLPIEEKIKKIEAIIGGWVNYFAQQASIMDYNALLKPD